MVELEPALVSAVSAALDSESVLLAEVSLDAKSL